MNVESSAELPDLPWEDILESINEQYQQIIAEQFGDNGELVEVLKKTGVIAIEYQPDASPDEGKGDGTSFWETTSIAVTDELQRLLIADYGVPREIARHIFPSQFGTTVLYYSSWGSNCWRRVDCTKSDPAGNKYVSCPC